MGSLSNARLLVRGRWIGATLACVLAATGCSPAREPYAWVHDAALSADGGAVLLLVDSGVATLSGSVVSSTWSRQVAERGVWRFERSTGRLSRERRIAVDPRADASSLTLAGVMPSTSVPGASLPDCAAAMTRCALARTPQPYVVRDLRDGRARGIAVIDPEAGVRLVAQGEALVAEPWEFRTRETLARERDARLHAVATRTFAAGRAFVAKSVAATGRLPDERSPTIIDSSLATGMEGLMPQYFVEPGGAIAAELGYGADPRIVLRWTPASERGADGLPAHWRCESANAEVARWMPDCAVVPAARVLDPELAYVRTRVAQLRADAARDPAHAATRRGATFGVRGLDAANDRTRVACLGHPATPVGECDLQQGDTACAESLPLLCVSSVRAQAPATAARLTPPVRGDALATRADAVAACTTAFGTEWSVAAPANGAELDSGYDVDGRIAPPQRMWIDVPDRPEARCWR